MSTFHSDSKRDARDTIRGYLYQIQLTVIRWLTLESNTVLYCECGEDIDHVRQVVENNKDNEERIVEQVKALSRNITLRSGESITSLARYKEHLVKNSNNSIKLIYWFSTTANPGKERASENVSINFPKDFSGIEAWQAVQKDEFSQEEIEEFVSGFKKLIESAKCPDKLEENVFLQLKDYIKSTASDTLINDFVKKFYWKTSLEQPENLDEKIKNLLICQSTVNSEEEAIQLTDTLTSYILHFLSKAGTKKLTKEDLVNFLQKRQVPDYARTLLHTIKSLKFIEETLLSISSKVDGVTELLSKQQQPKCVNVDWQKCCQTLLEKQRKLTSNSLMYSDGISKSFEDVFVPLGLVERQQKSKKADVTPTQGSKLYELEEYEIIKEYNQDEFFKEILTEGKSTKSNGKRLVVIGEPGSGKTTLLQKIADNILNNIRGYPILIFLSDLQGKNLKEYLFNKWLEDATLTGIIEDEVKKDFERLFHSGHVWLLLDGVDEIGKDAATTLKEINKQFVGLLGEARIILTCRTNVWDAGKNSLVDFDVFKSLDFSYGDSKYPNQVKLFISRWFSSNSLLGDRLCQELEKPGKERIKDIVKNPLRLALLCKFWQLGEQKLPDTKASLYKGFIDAIYDWKSDIFPAKQTVKDKLGEFLGYLAKSALNKEKYHFRLEISFIREKIKELKQKKGLGFEEIFELAEKIGLLNNVGVAMENPQEKVYAFIHPTFQEYFAAQYISNWNYFFKHVSNNLEVGNYRIFDNTWKEVILLWLGRDDVKAKRKEAFFQALVNFDDGCGDGYKARASFLVASGIAEFKEFNGSDEIIKKIVDWGFGSPNTDSFTGSFRKSDRAVLTETENTKATDTLVNQIKNNVHLGVIKEAALHLQLVQSKVFVIDLLSGLLDSDNDLFSKQIVTVLGEIDPNNQKITSTLERLCCSKEEEIRCSSAGSLLFRITNNNTAVNTLLDLLRTSNNSRIIWESMHHLRVVCEPPRQDVIDALINIIRSSNDQDRIMDATLYLERMVVGNKKAITDLESVITESTNWRKIYYVVDLLKEISPNNKASINRLEELLALYKQNEELSVEIAQVLAWVEEGNSKAADALINLLVSQDDYIQNQASMALEALVPKCPLIIDKLIEFTRVTSSEILHKWVAWVLRKTDKSNTEITGLLSTILKNAKNDETIYYSALSLREKSPSNGEALNALLKLIKRASAEVEIRVKTIQSLEESNCKDTNFVTALTDVLEEQQQRVCCYAAEALYKIGANKELAISKLRFLLNSDDKDLIPEVIRVLERLEVKQGEVVDDLINILKKLETVEKRTLVRQKKSKIYWEKFGEAQKQLKLEQDTLKEKLELEQEALELNQEMLELEREKKIVSQAASALRKLTENPEEIYPQLVKLLQDHPNEYVHQITSEMLKKNISRNNLLLLVKALKKCVFSVFVNKPDEQHRNCREMYWYCVQNMSYPEFYKAWYS